MRITDGSLLCYRVFDVGNAIDLAAVERRAGAKCTRSSAHAGSVAVSYAEPPLTLALGERTLPGDIEARVSARLFDFGGISILFDLAVPSGKTLQELVPTCADLYESRALSDVARAEVDRLVAEFGGAIEGPHGWREFETYTVVVAREIEGRPRAADVLAAPALAKLVIGETDPRPLSSAEVASALKRAYSYFEDDLAVVDWNSAFVVDVHGGRAVCDLLEMATSQLLELRYYEQVFDRELARTYEHLGKVREGPLSLLRDPHARFARATLRRLVELTEFTERVDNALKIVGDPYLANVYDGAVKRFRLQDLRASVDGKQALVAQAYGFIRSEREARLGVMMEVVVIVLITAELITAFRH
jgi:hypothetical protein